MAFGSFYSPPPSTNLNGLTQEQIDNSAIRILNSAIDIMLPRKLTLDRAFYPILKGGASAVRSAERLRAVERVTHNDCSGSMRCSYAMHCPLCPNRNDDSFWLFRNDDNGPDKGKGGPSLRFKKMVISCLPVMKFRLF